MPIVCPSGAARTTRPIPTEPAAPVTFSTMNDWPSVRSIRSPSRRASVSAGPPAVNGTMMVTGFDVCAEATAAHCSAAPKTAANTHLNIAPPCLQGARLIRRVACRSLSIRLARDLQCPHEAGIADIPSDQRGQHDELLWRENASRRCKHVVGDIAAACRLLGEAQGRALPRIEQRGRAPSGERIDLLS